MRWDVYCCGTVALMVLGHVPHLGSLASLSRLFNYVVTPGLLLEETGIPGENHLPVSRVTDELYHIMWYHVHPP